MMEVHMLSVAVLLLVPYSAAITEYYGKKIGSLSTLFHEVTGDVYAVDSSSIHIRNFKYDGAGPDAFFWGGSTPEPSAEGFIIPDEKGTKEVLQPYNNRHITLQLPDRKTLKDIKWISVWCRKFRADFGNVLIPEDFVPPASINLGPLPGVEHDMSSGDVVIVDAQTFMVPNFTLDGLAPDAHFWVGKGDKPTPDGILVGDENGSDKPLGRYDKKSLVITLPSNVTVFDIDHFGVWCKIAAADFGHLKMPSTLNVPPSLRMLGQSVKNKLNCELLNENPVVEIRWILNKDHIIFQLVSTIKIGDYMSFGLSGDPLRSAMVNGDVAVAWIDKDNKGHAIDYFMDSKAQCAGGTGVCPDNKITPNSDNIHFLSATEMDGVQIVTYERSLETGDSLDKPFLRDQPQAVIWALGSLNSLNEASFHHHWSSEDKFIFFNRHPSWNCPSNMNEGLLKKHRPHSLPSNESLALPEVFQPPLRTEPITSSPKVDIPEEPATDRWSIPPIECDEPADGVFYAQMGPTGGKKGYTAITGNVGWGIAWYINGLLIPEITVVRGKTYRFVIEGGGDPANPSRNHPFYITDDPVGGYGTKTDDEKVNVRIFAGIEENKSGIQPTGFGRLCQWVPKEKRSPEEYESFGEFQQQLELKCGEGRPGMLAWTPDADTPDTVYYQCFTHRYLGWKIHVIDSCDKEPVPEASGVYEVRVPAPKRMKVEVQNHSMSSSVESNAVSPKIIDLPVAHNVEHPNTSKHKITQTRTGDEKYSYSKTANISKKLNPEKYLYKNIQQKIQDTYLRIYSKFPAHGPERTSDLIKDPLQAEASDENPVVFRAQGGRNIPPLPSTLPFTKNSPRRPPVLTEVKSDGHPISYDGSPVLNAHFSSAQPSGPDNETKNKPSIRIAYDSQYGPFQGNKPPPVPEYVPQLPQFQRIPLAAVSRNKAQPRNSDMGETILNNIWNIISSQKGNRNM